MSERDGYRPGVPCWVTAVEPDPDGATAFYAELFGWEIDDLMGPDHPESYYVCRLRGRKVAGIVSPHGAPEPPAALWTTHIWVNDADEVAARVADAGGSIIGPPFDSPAGGRIAVLADPTGAVFCAWQPKGHRGAEVVNEPGAWAMSMLHTTDPGRAIEFYTSIFGWRPEAFAMGSDSMTLLRLTGYVGGEPHQPVARDVVAVMLTADAAPSHWSMDFRVADADGTAAGAARLGGQVIVAPRDVPGFRNTVLADPAGATFSVSQLIV